MLSIVSFIILCNQNQFKVHHDVLLILRPNRVYMRIIVFKSHNAFFIRSLDAAPLRDRKNCFLVQHRETFKFHQNRRKDAFHLTSPKKSFNIILCVTSAIFAIVSTLYNSRLLIGRFSDAFILLPFKVLREEKKKYLTVCSRFDVDGNKLEMQARCYTRA